MTTYVALFRGINVSGRNMLPMKELAAILESIGARNVRTYIQSGNAVFESTGKAERLSSRIRAAVETGRGFAPHVLILQHSELECIVRENPFPEAAAAPKTLHVGFLAGKAEHPNLQRLTAFKTPSERFVLTARAFYLHAPDGIGRSKLAANAERLLGVPMTDRNWNTVVKLLELAAADRS